MLNNQLHKQWIKRLDRPINRLLQLKGPIIFLSCSTSWLTFRHQLTSQYPWTGSRCCCSLIVYDDQFPAHCGSLNSGQTASHHLASDRLIHCPHYRWLRGPGRVVKLILKRAGIVQGRSLTETSPLIISWNEPTVQTNVQENNAVFIYIIFLASLFIWYFWPVYSYDISGQSIKLML